MINARFLLCRSCGVLHSIESATADLSPEAREEALRELEAFESEHGGHPLEEVVRNSPSASLDRPAWDPMATLWFFVRSGSEELLVRASRASIEEPRRYTLMPEPPPSEGLVEIDAALVRRALDRHFFPQAVSARKLDHFVSALAELVADIDPQSIETSFDDPEYANAGIGALPEEVCHALLSRAAALFDAWELERVCAFVAEHRREDGALALRVHRTVDALSA
jgi:hypothetical protein